MVSNKTVKIFVEPDEEIVFIVEKIRAAQSGRIIMIVPNTAALISSAVSLKVLARQIIKTDKLIVLVSDTEVAKSLGAKAQIQVCPKVSEVDTEAWQHAKALKEKLADSVNKVKEELLSARREPPGAPLKVEDLLSKVLPKKSDNKDKAVGMEQPERELVIPQTTADKAKEMPKVKAVIMDEPKEEPKLVIKPRLKERVIDINGIKLVAGGDILNNKELLKLERERGDRVLELNLESEDNDEVADEDQDMYKDSGLLGVDMTRQMGKREFDPVNRQAALRPPRPSFFKKIGKFFQRVFTHVSVPKLLLGFVVAILLFFGISYFFFTSANVEITQATTSLTIKKSVTAKIDDANAYNATNLVIPALTITKDATVTSEAPATGKGSTGEYAQGLLLIYNPSATDVKLKAGQLFDYNYNSQTLRYRALADVTIPAGAPKSANVNIKAENNGAQYNIPDTMKSFLVEGYAGLTSQNISAISGGTTVEATVVSKEDITDLKASMSEQLKTQLLNTLRTTLSSDDYLFAGSEIYTENTFTTTLAEGVVGEKFNATMKMTISAVIISWANVRKLLTEVGAADNGFTTINVKQPTIDNVVVAKTQVTFDTRANATGSTQIDVEAIRAMIKGKSVTEAKDLIKGQTGVASVFVRFNPPYIPLSMQKIPDNDGKLTVVVTDNAE